MRLHHAQQQQDLAPRDGGLRGVVRRLDMDERLGMNEQGGASAGVGAGLSEARLRDEAAMAALFAGRRVRESNSGEKVQRNLSLQRNSSPRPVFRDLRDIEGGSFKGYKIRVPRFKGFKDGAPPSTPQRKMSQKAKDSPDSVLAGVGGGGGGGGDEGPDNGGPPGDGGGDPTFDSEGRSEAILNQGLAALDP